MPPLPDQTGRKFGMLSVVERAEIFIRPNGKKDGRFLCECECGNRKVVRWNDLQTGNTRSCGCTHRRRGKSNPNYVHGMGQAVERRGRASTEYAIWNGMKGRCNQPTHISYKYYGAKGIKVCGRWNRFENFFSDMGPRPSPNHSIDRIDGSRDYSPENCRWATAKEQFQNLEPSEAFKRHMGRGNRIIES